MKQEHEMTPGVLVSDEEWVNAGCPSEETLEREHVKALESAARALVQLVFDDVIRVRPSDKERLMNAVAAVNELLPEV